MGLESWVCLISVETSILISIRLRVWIDLHGAPGSQNGFDNSGRKGDIEWQNDYNNIQRTLNVLSTITSRYGSHPAVAGIE